MASNKDSSGTRCCIRNWSFKCKTGTSNIYFSLNSFGHSSLCISNTVKLKGVYHCQSLLETPLFFFFFFCLYNVTFFCTFKIDSLAVVHREHVLDENKVNATFLLAISWKCGKRIKKSSRLFLNAVKIILVTL